jgi:excisionase family DNA binding protein
LGQHPSPVIEVSRGDRQRGLTIGATRERVAAGFALPHNLGARPRNSAPDPVPFPGVARVTKPRTPGSLRPYTTGEIAKLLNVHPSTVHHMLDAGAMPWHWSKAGPHRGWRLVTVKDWNTWRRKNAP